MSNIKYVIAGVNALTAVFATNVAQAAETVETSFGSAFAPTLAAEDHYCDGTVTGLSLKGATGPTNVGYGYRNQAQVTKKDIVEGDRTFDCKDIELGGYRTVFRSEQGVESIVIAGTAEAWIEGHADIGEVSTGGAVVKNMPGTFTDYSVTQDGKWVLFEHQDTGVKTYLNDVHTVAFEYGDVVAIENNDANQITTIVDPVLRMTDLGLAHIMGPEVETPDCSVVDVLDYSDSGTRITVDLDPAGNGGKHSYAQGDTYPDGLCKHVIGSTGGLYVYGNEHDNVVLSQNGSNAFNLFEGRDGSDTMIFEKSYEGTFVGDQGKWVAIFEDAIQPIGRGDAVRDVENLAFQVDGVGGTLDQYPTATFTPAAP